jgi:uncharacterized protein (TIGR02246 family)
MDVKEALQDLMDRYVAAYRAGDSAGCAAVFTENAELRSPYGPAAIGRDAIARTHEEWTAEGAEGKRIDVVSAGVSGDLAWCLAAFSEGSETGEGKSLSVLERQPGGSWLIRMCSLTP